MVEEVAFRFQIVGAGHIDRELAVDEGEQVLLDDGGQFPAPMNLVGRAPRQKLLADESEFVPGHVLDGELVQRPELVPPLPTRPVAGSVPVSRSPSHDMAPGVVSSPGPVPPHDHDQLAVGCLLEGGAALDLGHVATTNDSPTKSHRCNLHCEGNLHYQPLAEGVFSSQTPTFSAQRRPCVCRPLALKWTPSR
jgi:hypothetical protein